MNTALYGQPTQPLVELSISVLENRLLEIDSRIAELAEFSFQTGVGSNGNRSDSHTEPNHREWFQVELEGFQNIDQIILVPHIVKDSKLGVISDGFPAELEIIAGTAMHPEGELITQFRPTDGDQHIAPYTFATPGLQASWIRIQATELSPRAWDLKYNLQLAEILIFEGNHNHALGSKVTASSQSRGYDSSRNERYLVDGFMPYTMNAASGEQSIAMMVRISEPHAPLAISIDLEDAYQLDRIHLHRIELSNNMPLSKGFDFGMPRRLLIEGSNQADFSESTVLLDLHLKNAYESGPIIMRDLNPQACRFVRLTAVEPFIDTLMPEPTIAFGFAEIELFSNQTNVAYQKTPTTNFEYSSYARPLTKLTDGQNFYGTILPIREWLEQLEERYHLEAERPLIRAELDRRYARQSITLRRMSWLAMLLTTGIVVVILVDRILRLRQIARIRERFAADLHDDLGASLHTIGLLGDIALSSVDSPERLKTALTRSRELTKRAGAAIRHCTDLQTMGRVGDLEQDIRRIAERMLVNSDYTISVQGANYFNKLKPRLKMDLFLFVKESITNIVKHSNADQVSIEMNANSSLIEIKIQDDGRGLPDDKEQKVPPSLKRRARVMHASISISHSAEYSTIIHLCRKNSSLLFWQ
ncbi:hypothetical protein SH580_19865 [Coraliomargarita algicola]|uniref:Histidine kinase/HSP90-like ATPase domain-containing protein n=1 Tax=Coraliomargarita algicola TaxID=3092156 RepID=A0ABZ0RK86_9BACT|nr:ATP-binding protein [Coraliomargarita sp. J2-16]WPJ95679.1 hypothetical protein SH580_19865 [Coraliomargarita sp. J2-16]